MKNRKFGKVQHSEVESSKNALLGRTCLKIYIMKIMKKLFFSTMKSKSKARNDFNLSNTSRYSLELFRLEGTYLPER